MAIDKTKLLKRFIEEAREHTAGMTDGIMALEDDPLNMDCIHQIFRLAHTIKGASRMMKQKEISQAAHLIEEIMDALRNRNIRFTKSLGNILYDAISVLEKMLDETTLGKPLVPLPKDIENKLISAAQGKVPLDKEMACTADTEKSGKNETGDNPENTLPGPPGRAEQEPIIQKKESWPVEQKMNILENKTAFGNPDIQEGGLKNDGQEKRNASSGVIRVHAEKLDVLIKRLGEIITMQSRFQNRMNRISRLYANTKKSVNMQEGFFPVYKQPGDSPLNPAIFHQVRFNEIRDTQSKTGQKNEASDNTSSLMDQLDYYKNAIHGIYAELTDIMTEMREDYSLQKRLLRDIRESSLDMRMMPLSSIFEPFKRSVRAMAREIGKDINFLVKGGETELDRKIIDRIGDPILHMIRNSLEHGIEPIEKRQQNGKPKQATILLSASCEGEFVTICLSDDGNGISLQKIKEKAVQKGYASQAQLEKMPDQELLNLIFLPGFSTSEIITNLSGRGVGMDVVKKHVVEDLKGRIEIFNEQGKGVKFVIYLPLTMAIIHVLFIRAGELTFAVPATFIQEIQRFHQKSVINVVNKKAIRIKEEIIPLLAMEDALALPENYRLLSKDQNNTILVMVAGFGSEKMGFIIDDILDEKEMIIKPLPSHMQGLPLVSGCIANADNEISLVLHLPKIIENAKSMIQEARPEIMDKPIHILLVDDSFSTREIEKTILESYGYEVSLAGDGEEALEKATSSSFDLVITDVEMPRRNGFSLTKALRDMEEYREVPIILITTLDKEEDKKKGIMAGADAYIIKEDFDQGVLLETVKNLAG